MHEIPKKYCCVISDANVTDGNLTETCHSFFQLNRTKSGKWYNLLIKNGYLGCCMAFRKELLDLAIPFPEDTPMHDIWLGNVAAFKFNVCFIPQSLILFRRHGHNSSSTARKSTSSLKDKINFRYAICKGLFKLKNKHFNFIKHKIFINLLKIFILINFAFNLEMA